MNKFINQYRTEIYPFKLFVIHSPEGKIELEQFCHFDNGACFFETKSYDAFATVMLKHKSTKWNSIIVNLIKLDNITTGVIAHESYHATMGVFKYIGEDRPSEEATAYLLTWIANCVENSLIKFKKIKNES